MKPLKQEVLEVLKTTSEPLSIEQITAKVSTRHEERVGAIIRGMEQTDEVYAAEVTGYDVTPHYSLTPLGRVRHGIVSGGNTSYKKFVKKGPEKYPFWDMNTGDTYEFSGHETYAGLLKDAARKYEKRHNVKFSIKPKAACANVYLCTRIA